MECVALPSPNKDQQPCPTLSGDRRALKVPHACPTSSSLSLRQRSAYLSAECSRFARRGWQVLQLPAAPAAFSNGVEQRRRAVWQRRPSGKGNPSVFVTPFQPIFAPISPGHAPQHLLRLQCHSCTASTSEHLICWNRAMRQTMTSRPARVGTWPGGCQASEKGVSWGHHQERFKQECHLGSQHALPSSVCSADGHTRGCQRNTGGGGGGSACAGHRWPSRAY